MSFTPRFVLGLTLVFLLYLPNFSSSTKEESEKVSFIYPDKTENVSNYTQQKFNSTDTITKATDINELKDIVIKTRNEPKTDNNKKNYNVYVNNITTIDNSTKLKQSEPYKKIDEDTEKTRSNNGRSINFDISKFVSEEFHNEKNHYTSPISNTENYDFKYPINESILFTSELTTPKIDYFDNNHKAIVQSVQQKLEERDLQIRCSSEKGVGKTCTTSPNPVLQFNRNSDEISAESSESNENISLNDYIDKANRNDTNADLDYVKYEKLEANDTKKKNGIHKDYVSEQATNINFRSSYNETRVIGEEPEDVQNNIPLLEDNIKSHDEEKMVENNYPNFREENRPKNKSSYQRFTTKKTIVKPLANNNNSSSNSLLNNRIETEIVKPVEPNKCTPENPCSTATTQQGQVETLPNIPVRKSTTIQVAKRGSVRYHDTVTPAPLLKTTISKRRFNGSEQTVQENQIIPIQIPPPVNNNSSKEGTTESSLPEIPKITSIVHLKVVNYTKNNDVFTTSIVTTTEPLTTTFMQPSNVSFTTVLPTTTTDSSTSTTETSTQETTEIPISTTEVVMQISTVQSSTDETTENFDMSSTTTDLDTTIFTLNTESNPSTTIDNRREDTTDYPESFEKSLKTTLNSRMNAQRELNFTTSDFTTITESNEDSTTIETTTSKNDQTTESSPETTTVSINTESNSEIDLFQTTTQASITTTEDFIGINNNETTTVSPSIMLQNTSDLPIPIKKSDLNSTLPTTPTFTTEETEEMTDSTTTSENLGVTGSDEDGNAGTIAAIALSCVGAICLILLAGLLIIMRKRQKHFNYGQRCTPVSLDAYSMDNVSTYNSVRRKGAARCSMRSYGNPAFDDPSSVTHTLNFPALAKFALNEEDIKAEFEEIPQVTARTNELPEGCETKNRYANVIPLPETRVFLTTIDGYPNSDYINANYVTGPKNTRGYYIATQAPMQNTIDDFWRMIWEQQSKIILMLTHLFENGAEKCIDYLPPSEVLDCHRLFGDFQVTLKNREVKDKYIISSLQLKNMVSNSWREVTHFWYLGWPEKGVPTEENSIIAFLIEARSYIKLPSGVSDKTKEVNGNSRITPNPDVNPVVVHCSPGTGRTGTVIACDIAIREFELTRHVDIPRIVYKIRRDRASSVQTKDQYSFIYKVINLYATKLTGGALDSF